MIRFCAGVGYRSRSNSQTYRQIRSLRVSRIILSPSESNQFSLPHSIPNSPGESRVETFVGAHERQRGRNADIPPVYNLHAYPTANDRV